MHDKRTRRGQALPPLALAAVSLAVIAALSGCSGTPGRFWKPADQALIWPLPPDPPRIRYEGAITAATIRENGTGHGFAALLRFAVGAPTVKLGAPHGISADAMTLAVADSAQAAVHLLDLASGGYRVVETAGEARLECPIGVAADGEGGVFVTDSVLRRVFHFSRRGKLQDEIAGEFLRPTGIAYDASRRRLYVVDTAAHSVLTFEEVNGRQALVRRLGGRGEEGGHFNYPTHASVAANGNLCVTDSLNFRIQIFSPDGALVQSFGRAGNGVGEFVAAKGVAADSDGHIYVVDSLSDVVQVFDESGRFLLPFGGYGSGAGELWLPTGICIDRDNRIYVADPGNSRIQVYQYVHQPIP